VKVKNRNEEGNFTHLNKRAILRYQNTNLTNDKKVIEKIKKSEELHFNKTQNSTAEFKMQELLHAALSS
jgi:hypothetical protein